MRLVTVGFQEDPISDEIWGRVLVFVFRTDENDDLPPFGGAVFGVFPAEDDLEHPNLDGPSWPPITLDAYIAREVGAMVEAADRYCPGFGDLVRTWVDGLDTQQKAPSNATRTETSASQAPEPRDRPDLS